jgi:GT2 family glycosyltransferase
LIELSEGQRNRRPVIPVGVVIVAWNAEQYIGDCLSSVERLERKAQEVVVVDNASQDDTARLAQASHPRAKVIRQATNVGFARANNIGIAANESPFLLVLNPDTRLEPDFLEKLLPAFDDPAVGIACGKLLRFDGRTIDSAGQQLGRSRQPIDRGYGRADHGQFDRDEEVFGACGAAALYRRSMLEAIADEGGAFFDEGFFAFYEDLDLAWRARKLGWKAVYRHRAVAYHARGGTAGTAAVRERGRALLSRSPELRYHIVKNRYLTILRNDKTADYVRDLPFIVARDLATLALLLWHSPEVLPRLWKARAIFRRAWTLRRRDAERPSFSVTSFVDYNGIRRGDNHG